MHRIFGFLVMAALSMLAPKPPILVGDNKAIYVSFEKGAVGACTVYTSEHETIQDSDGKQIPYAPRHCWLLSELQDSYPDDWAFIKPDKGVWTVKAEVFYPASDAPDAEILTVESNTLKVRY